MIAAIPASENRIEAETGDRFARCPYFCFYNTDTGDIEFRENDMRDASEGVGPQVVEFLAKNGINEVYASEVGPKALSLLNKLNIKTTIIKPRLTVKQVINMLNN